MDLVGFDIKQNRVSMMNTNEDPSGELPRTAFHNRKINFTANVNDLAEAKFYIVAVPTPVDANKKPNLNALISATQMVGTVLKKGDYVVFESIVYPGCTEEVCQPILESNSGLKAGVDFKIGYSPERINPGDKKHTLAKITKVVSGCDQEACDVILDFKEFEGLNFAIVKTNANFAGLDFTKADGIFIENESPEVVLNIIKEVIKFYVISELITTNHLR